MFEIFKILFGSTDPGTNLLVQARDKFLEMLALAGQLLRKEEEHLLDAEIPKELVKEARAIDKSTNLLEREIRKLLVEHLGFSQADAPACLVLMSVAKDAERLVDECRTLVSLDKFLTESSPQGYRDAIKDRADQIIALVDRTREVFAANDEAGALTILEEEKPFNAGIAEVQEHVLADGGLSGRQAAVIHHGLHILRRIRAHLGNIASTVVLPLHQIDFAKKTFIEQARKTLETGEERGQTEPGA